MLKSRVFPSPSSSLAVFPFSFSRPSSHWHPLSGVYKLIIPDSCAQNASTLDIPYTFSCNRCHRTPLLRRGIWDMPCCLLLTMPLLPVSIEQLINTTAPRIVGR